MGIITQNDYSILKAIIDEKDNEKGILATKGTSKSEIKTKTGLSYSKIHSTLKNLLEFGYIRMGLKNKNSNTYTLTEEGCKMLFRCEGKGEVVDNE